MKELSNAVVIGAGTMGSGIAQALAVAGLRVNLFDLNAEATQRAKATIEKSLTKLSSKGKLSEAEASAALGRVLPTTDLGCAGTVDMAIEVIVENLEAKRELFQKLDQACPAEALLLTNTSSLSVTDMANAARPERRPRIAGMHFFNPVPIMKLVEVVRTPFTSDETFKAVWQLAEKCGKSPVEAKDTPGFLFNRLILPYLNEAMWAVHEGVGRIEDIDKAMLLGGNMPIGPLALADLVGLDICLHAIAAIRDETGEPKYRPCPLNRQMVRAGYLGRKSGVGFYDYRTDEKKPVDLSVFRF
ncbi:MAG: 3-hydroxyacyl-CoA dehydrogenase NAD-binding domain-containing protein [Vulcanimicrobiota bacterium]